MSLPATYEGLLAEAARCARAVSEDDDIFADVLPDVMRLDMAESGLPAWSGAIPPLPPPAESAKRAAPKSTAGSTVLPPPKLRKKSGMAGAPSVHDVASKTAALEQWAVILKEIAGSCTMSLRVGAAPTAQDLEPYFATRRPGTLNLHASAWKLFLRYAAVKGLDTHAITEAMAFEYVRHLNDTDAPPSRAAAFLRACNFALGLCGFSAGDVVRISPRCRGAAAMSLARRLPRRQRDILLTRWIVAAEAEVALAALCASDLSDQEASVLGFAFFCTHTRARFSDAAKNCSEPFLDLCAAEDALNFSYVETHATG